VKKKVSPQLLSVAGVSGVGVPQGRLTVYLAEDTPTVRRSVADTLQQLECDTPVDFVLTGPFRAQGPQKK
jgi:hypothetical protein